MSTKQSNQTKTVSTLKVVELNKSTENPFYGLQHCLSLYQNASKGVLDIRHLDNCWAEVRNDKVRREMFFMLLFSIGDITARQHNIFGKTKVDGGGSAQRKAFDIVMKWFSIGNDQILEQFKAFLFAGLFNEYTSFDTLLKNRVTTKKKSKTVLSMDSAMLNSSRKYIDYLAEYCAQIIVGTNITAQYFLAKFLTRPRLSKRKGHKLMLPQTKSLMRTKEYFLSLVSAKAGLRIIKKKTHIEFVGYYEWRKQFNSNLESVKFSNKTILDMDEQEFLKWLDGLPAGARYRVRTRLLTKDNKPKLGKIEQEAGTAVSRWHKLPEWFLKWEEFKEKKQTEVRVIEEEIRQGQTLSARGTDLTADLNKAKKQAKVTTGAVNFADLFTQIVNGTVDRLKVQPFLDKFSLPYNTLVFADDSRSMDQGYGTGYGFTPFQFAVFMATICLMKNPEDSGRSLLGMFSMDCRMHTHLTVQSNTANSIMRVSSTKVLAEPLIKPELHFLDNLERMKSFMNCFRTGNNTNISSIPERLSVWVAGDVTRIEMLQQFPVWTLISDGNWNNMSSPEASMNDFMMKCERYFGYRPFIIAIDVAGNSSAHIGRFQGIKNFMYIPPNPAQIEQLLTNFKDMDIMDVYTPLQSLYRSNRYAIVKENTL